MIYGFQSQSHFDPSKNTHDVGVVFSPILQMKILSRRDLLKANWDEDPGLLSLAPFLSLFPFYTIDS